MLSPDSTASSVILGVVFALLLVALVVNALVKDRKEYRRFAQMTSSRSRRRMLGKWLLQSFLFFGASSAITLVLAWRFVPLVLEQVDAVGWVAHARRDFANSDLAIGLTIGIVVAVAVFLVVGVVLSRKEAEIASVGDVQALLPRNRRELKFGVGLSINAGIVEELLFRLAMPAIVFSFTSSALVAIVVSLVVFGALHAYQGIAGVIGATIIGVILMAIYLATENILVAIAAHALFDLRSLVLIPLVVTRAHRIAADD